MFTRPFKEPHKIDGEFGDSRSYGVHSGEDWNGVEGGNTDCGYKLYPIADGEVIHTSEADVSYGKVIVYKIEGAWGTRWVRYCHCQEILAKDGSVTQETPIATLGTTGNSTACHLHWDIIKKPLTNWRMFARDEATLNEYFEAPTTFFNMWKDAKEETDMPKWFETLLQERGLTIEDEGEIRAIFDRAKRYEDEVSELKEQVKSANEALAEKSIEVSTLTDKITDLQGKVDGLQENLNKARSERDTSDADKVKTEAMVERLETELQKATDKIERLEGNTPLYGYTWWERFVSLFKGGD